MSTRRCGPRVLIYCDDPGCGNSTPRAEAYSNQWVMVVTLDDEIKDFCAIHRMEGLFYTPHRNMESSGWARNPKGGGNG